MVAAGQTSYDTIDSGVTILAPSTAPQGSTFQTQLTADPIEVPTTGGGYPVKQLKNVDVRFDLPAGATFVGATLSGGSQLGAGTPSVSLVGNQIVLHIPGNLSPGTTAVLPTVTATLQATGTVGTVLQAKMSGSSFADPGITFQAVVTVFFFDVTADASCYAPVNPVLAETTIT